MRPEHYHDPACVADRRFPRWAELDCTCRAQQHTNVSAPQAGAPTPGPYRVVRSSEDGNFYVEGFLCETNTCERGEADRDCSLVNEAYAAGLEAARNEEQESLRRIAVQASALGDCECSEEIGELCNRCALVDIIGRRIAAIRALAGADQKGARG